MYAERMLTLTTFSKRKNTHGNEDRLHVYSLREVNPISGTAYFLSISECNFWCVFYFPVTWLFGVLRVNNKSDIDDSRSFLRHLILNLVLMKHLGKKQTSPKKRIHRWCASWFCVNNPNNPLYYCFYLWLHNPIKFCNNKSFTFPAQSARLKMSIC